MRRNVNTVKLALHTFQEFGMITLEDDYIYIENWEKHQNVEGMEKIKEQNRIRQQKYREKQRQIEQNNVKSRDSNGTDKTRLDKNREEQVDISSLPTEDKMSKRDIQVFKKYLSERGKKDFPPRFAAVHAKWPKKDDKKASAQAWLETLKTDSIDDMEKAVDNYLQANKDTDPQYIKGLKTFFGPSEPWRDYVKMSFTKSQSHDNINLIANKLKEDV